MNTPAPVPAAAPPWACCSARSATPCGRGWQRELAAAGHDLTFSQYITLKKLADGTAGVTDLARAAELNPGAMTRLLDKLEATGLIGRVADPDDRRALHIHLTDAGLAIWQRHQPVRQARARARDARHERSRTRTTHRACSTQVRDNLSLTDPDMSASTPARVAAAPRVRALPLACSLAGCASTHGLAPQGKPLDADTLAAARSLGTACPTPRSRSRTGGPRSAIRNSMR